MAVNTPSGLTQRQKITDSVLQGDTYSSLLASVQVDSIGQECARAGYGYKYMDQLHFGILGLVDDTVAVTEVGFKAHIMNVFMNIKTAEKGLQFGSKKCRIMMVGKNIENVPKTNLRVDTWSVHHKENRNTGDTDLVEDYAGQIEIESCTEQKYLGFVISSAGNNMANINAVKRRSNGIIRKTRLRSKVFSLEKIAS